MRLACLALLLCSLPAQAAEEAAWLAGLQDRIAADVAAGRPLVVVAHAPLCSNRVLRCGNARLGDGDAPATNLYWATSGGFVRWFPAHGWKLVATRGPEGEVLETRVWRRRVAPSALWRARGVRRPFEVVVVAHAWRGTAIDAAVAAYVRDLWGSQPAPVRLDDGREIAAGGAAHVVAFVGHNRWMDVPPYRWPEGPSTPVKGTIAIACKTTDYLMGAVPARSRVPLLMTTDFLFAGAHSFEGTVSALAEGRDLAGIRKGAVAAYAAGQGKPEGRVRGAFTNPSDRRWRRLGPR